MEQESAVDLFATTKTNCTLHYFSKSVPARSSETVGLVYLALENGCQSGAQYKTLTHQRTSSGGPRWLELDLFSLKQRRLRQDSNAVFSCLMKIIEQTKSNSSWMSTAKRSGAVDTSYNKGNSNATLWEFSQRKSTLKKAPESAEFPPYRYSKCCLSNWV